MCSVPLEKEAGSIQAVGNMRSKVEQSMSGMEALAKKASLSLTTPQKRKWQNLTFRCMLTDLEKVLLFTRSQSLLIVLLLR